MSLFLLLFIAMLVLTQILALWGFLAMASWSDRQLTRAWQEWQEAKADAGSVTE